MIELEVKYIIKPQETFRAGTHTYIAIRESDWKKIEQIFKEDR